MSRRRHNCSPDRASQRPPPTLCVMIYRVNLFALRTSLVVLLLVLLFLLFLLLLLLLLLILAALVQRDFQRSLFSSRPAPKHLFAHSFMNCPLPSMAIWLLYSKLTPSKAPSPCSFSPNKHPFCRSDNFQVENFYHSAGSIEDMRPR